MAGRLNAQGAVRADLFFGTRDRLGRTQTVLGQIPALITGSSAANRSASDGAGAEASGEWDGRVCVLAQADPARTAAVFARATYLGSPRADAAAARSGVGEARPGTAAFPPSAEHGGLRAVPAAGLRWASVAAVAAHAAGRDLRLLLRRAALFPKAGPVSAGEEGDGPARRADPAARQRFVVWSAHVLYSTDGSFAQPDQGPAACAPDGELAARASRWTGMRAGESRGAGLADGQQPPPAGSARDGFFTQVCRAGASLTV